MIQILDKILKVKFRVTLRAKFRAFNHVLPHNFTTICQAHTSNETSNHEHSAWVDFTIMASSATRDFPSSPQLRALSLPMTATDAAHQSSSNRRRSVFLRWSPSLFMLMMMLMLLVLLLSTNAQTQICKKKTRAEPDRIWAVRRHNTPNRPSLSLKLNSVLKENYPK